MEVTLKVGKLNKSLKLVPPSRASTGRAYAHCLAKLLNIRKILMAAPGR